MEIPRLTVQVPEVPSSRDEQVAVRLARNVARLFGVDFPDNEVGATFVGEYTEITREDLRFGVPMASKEPVRESASGKPISIAKPEAAISTSTLNHPQYGPDKKAGAVLAGANVLFDGLLPRVRSILRVTTLREDGGRVAPITGAMLWASLMEQVLIGQPGAFAAAVQARQAQRAYFKAWRPFANPDLDVTAREYGRPAVEEPSQGSAASQYTQPSFTLLDVSAQEALSYDDEDQRNQHRNMADELVNRWCQYHFAGPEGAVAFVRGDRTGSRRWLETFVPPERMSSLLQEMVTSLVPRLPTMDARDLRPIAPSDPAWNDPESGLFERLLPRVPTPVDVAQCDTEGQVTLFWTLTHCYDNLVVAPFTDHVNLRRRIREQMIAILTMACETIPPKHPSHDLFEGRLLAYRCRHTQRKTVGSVSRDVESGISDYAEDVKSSCDFLNARAEEVARSTRIDDGYLYLLPDFSVNLNRYARDLDYAGRFDQAAEVRGTLKNAWNAGFANLGILSLDGRVKDPGDSLGSWLHNFVAFLGSDSRNQGDLEATVELMKRVVIPARANMARARRQERAKRMAIAILLRAVDKVTADGGRIPDDDEVRFAREYLGLRFIARIAGATSNHVPMTANTFFAALGVLRAAAVVTRAGGKIEGRESDLVWGAHRYAKEYMSRTDFEGVPLDDIEAFENLAIELRAWEAFK